MALGLLAAALPARAVTPLPKIPVIQNVGVVPVQWEGDAFGLDAAKQGLDEAFPKAVRGARRFRVLSDDLVAGLWQSADGREELRREFEAHGFVSLTVTPRGDVAALTARLLDSYLKTDLLETETVSRAWLQSADGPALSDKLEKLVYRLFNRLPVDVSVTSVQGQYLTLSGGADQGIEVGDEVDLVRAQVRSLHPANGTWLEFQKVPLGKAQVIEAKTYTSVAKITQQTYDDAIEVGDGARVAAIASRQKFARMAANDGFKDSGNPQTIIVPPLYQGGPPPAKAQPQKAPVPPPNQLFGPSKNDPSEQPAPQDGGQPQQYAQNDNAPAPAQQPQQQPQPGQEQPGGNGNNGSVWDEFAGEATSHKLLDSVTVYTGPYWWHMSSKAVNDSGKFPLWLLNSIGASVSRTMFYKIKADFGGGFLFGKTPNGTYFGYDSFGRMYWEDTLDVGSELLSWWKAGGAASFSGMNVPGTYGGGDWVRGGFFGGLGGTVRAGEENDRYDWFGEFMILPLNIGRFGYDGHFKTVQSSFGWKFDLGAFKYEPAQVLQWGGAIQLGSEEQTLKNHLIPTIKEYWIKIMAKYVM